MHKNFYYETGVCAVIRQSKKLLLLFGALVSFLLLTRVVIITPALIDTVGCWITYPLLLIQDTLISPWRSWQLRRKSADELCAALKHYQEQASQLLAENIALSAQQLHNQQIAELVSFGERYKTEQAVIGQVILKHIGEAGHFFLVDAGSNRGISVDMIAVYNNCLLGRVSEVHPAYCKVTLITDKLSKVPVICVATQAQGIHEGINSLTESRLEFVSHLQELRVGDLVLSSGDGLIYPKGFAVGIVRDFTLNSLGLNYIVSVTPLIDFMSIHHCYLVQKGAEYQGSPAPEGTGEPSEFVIELSE
jgi:rod shape-determining protein MreC